MAAPGRLYPAMTGHPDRWLGWRECHNGDPACMHANLSTSGVCGCGWEEHEHFISRGVGPRDSPQMISEAKDERGRKIKKTIPAIISGRDLRLKRLENGEEVLLTFDISRALACGDLLEYVAEQKKPAMISQEEAERLMKEKN